MGLDVCHGNTAESASSGSGQSVVVLCGSMNEPANRYYPSIGYQDARREVVLKIGDMVTDVTLKFSIFSQLFRS
jgi:hypothetical protein